MPVPLPLLPPAIPELPACSPAPREIVGLLLSWFQQYGRSFPWRTSHDPFRVLIAEILLRKTGARAVEQYLPCFFLAYPAPEHLARAEEDALAGHLAVLGLSRQRARQLRDLAAMLVSQHGGKVPGDLHALLRLPGVGVYTAAMVASTCFGVQTPAVDTNVARLLCRVFGLKPSHAEARKSTNVWQLAGSLTQLARADSARLTWAELDLAAATCTARRPNHTACPLRDVCREAKRASR